MAELESEQIASRMMSDACLRRGVEPNHLVIHSDNGGRMKGATLFATLQFLGIVPSFSRPHVSDGNPYSESLFRTPKYRPEYSRTAFENLEDANSWVEGFVQWHNTEHRNRAIKFVTPPARCFGEEGQVLTERTAIYPKAKRRNPCRWSS